MIWIRFHKEVDSLQFHNGKHSQKSVGWAVSSSGYAGIHSGGTLGGGLWYKQPFSLSAKKGGEGSKQRWKEEEGRGKSDGGWPLLSKQKKTIWRFLQYRAGIPIPHCIRSRVFRNNPLSFLDTCRIKNKLLTVSNKIPPGQPTAHWVLAPPSPAHHWLTLWSRCGSLNIPSSSLPQDRCLLERSHPSYFVTRSYPFFRNQLK